MNNMNNEPTAISEQSVFDDSPCSIEGFEDLENSQISDYYKNTVPMYNQGSVVEHDKELLLQKLNYMIHLLEEQRDEKTGHVTEEIILYSFLGVFIIFIMDSFARVGKYVR